MMHQIPFKTFVSKSSFIKGHYLAKSGVSFRNTKKELLHSFGFGFNSDEKSAIRASQFELYERFFADYEIYENKNINLTGHSFSDPLIKKKFPPEKILIGGSSVRKAADANGLGCHFLPDKAAQHAVLEIIERHLLAQIWYFETEIFEILADPYFQNSWRVRYYSVKGETPLAIAIVDNLENGIWVLGSAIRWPFEQAMQHAKNEAFMLLESSLSENGQSYSKDMDEKLLTLKDKQFSELREKHFQSKVKGQMLEPNYPFVLKRIIQNNIGYDNLWLIPLHVSSHFSVVRAISGGAKNPRWINSKKINSIPPDPFC